MLTLEFPAGADFHRRQAEEPKNVSVIREALYEVTGHRLGVTLALGEAEDAVEEEDDALTEEALISMFKDTFDATEVEDTRDEQVRHEQADAAGPADAVADAADCRRRPRTRSSRPRPAAGW